MIATGLVLFLSVAAWAAGDQANRILSLIDYIGGDYKNAVQGGQVANPAEYQEMSEFAARSAELFKQLKSAEGGDRAGIEKDLQTLVGLIKSKSGEEQVSKLAQSIKERLIQTYGIITYPRRLPTLASGKQLYDENCAQCHGATGQGDGPGRESMNPKTPLPANFTDPARIGGLSPFKVFNTTSFGIEGTAMASFAALSEEQRWQVAFYVFSLRFSEDASKAGARLLQEKNLPTDLIKVSSVATSTDAQLLDMLKAYAANDAEAINLLAYLRRGHLQTVANDPLSIARNLAREAMDLYKVGNREQAYQKAVEAYIDGYDLAEPAVFAKDMTFGRNLETVFTDFRNAIKQGVSVDDLERRHQDMETKLDQAEQMLARQDDLSSYYTFANSALIILREGLEATLILAAIMAMLKVMGAKEAIRYIHLGWIFAIFLGGLTWLATQTVLTLSGQHRESMEGFISIFAAAALFYVGFWLHTRSEAKKWHAFIQDKVKNSLSGKSVFGLMGISFFAVYREAFEVVLFYQALWLQNENNQGAVLWGFVAGFAALVVLTVAILKLGLKVPLKYFFGVTGTLLYLIAFIFAGTGIKQLQAAGWASTTPVNFPQLPFFGIYPTIETLTAQGLMLCAFLATTYWLARQRKRA